MTTKIMRTAQVNQLVKGLKEAGYEVETQRGEGVVHEVKLDGETIFWAMIHSSGKHFMVRYSPQLLS